MTLLDGEVVGSFSRTCLEAGIRSGLQQKFNQFDVSIIRSQMKRGVSLVRCSRIRRTSPRYQQANHIIPPSGCRCIDRQIRFVVAGFREHGCAGIQKHLHDFRPAKERSQMQRRPAIVGSLAHQPGILLQH